MNNKKQHRPNLFTVGAKKVGTTAVWDKVSPLVPRSFKKVAASMAVGDTEKDTAAECAVNHLGPTLKNALKIYQRYWAEIFQSGQHCIKTSNHSHQKLFSVDKPTTQTKWSDKILKLTKN